MGILNEIERDVKLDFIFTNSTGVFFFARTNEQKKHHNIIKRNLK